MVFAPDDSRQRKVRQGLAAGNQRELAVFEAHQALALHACIQGVAGPVEAACSVGQGPQPGFAAIGWQQDQAFFGAEIDAVGSGQGLEDKTQVALVAGQSCGIEKFFVGHATFAVRRQAPEGVVATHIDKAGGADGQGVGGRSCRQHRKAPVDAVKEQHAVEVAGVELAVRGRGQGQLPWLGAGMFGAITSRKRRTRHRFGQ